MKLIIGLGNPGKKYQDTWHNVGFMAVDLIKNQYADLNLKFKTSKKFKAAVAEVTSLNEKIILAKPQTFMNNSGQAVKDLVNFYKIDLADLWIIHDEVDLPLGKIRVSQNASAAGHKGIQSVINQLASQQFVRFRIGIHSDRANALPTEEYVLQKIDDSSKLALAENLQTVLSAIEISLTAGVAEAMNQFN